MITRSARLVGASTAVLVGVGLLASPGGAAALTERSVDFRLTAEGPEELFGNAVAPAGDVNGDGVADVLVGAPGVDSGRRRVLWVASTCSWDRWTRTRSASDADAIFTAEGVNDNLGYSIGAGDLNDDGLDDVILGARSNDWAGIQAGRVYVFFGPVTGSRSVTKADVKIAGKEFDEAGSAVAAGDVNDDGVSDLVVGAHAASGPGAFSAGQASVFFGPLSRGSRSVTAADVSLTGSCLQ